MKFQANRDGFIKGLHYYNASASVTSHTARLWLPSDEPGDETMLASKMFSNQPQVGWQYVYFDTPVAVTANTTYVISYDTVDAYPNVGGGLTAPLPSASPALRALADGEDGGNGVYSSGTGFPSNTWAGNNYFVDVIFDSVQPVAQLASPVSASGIAYTDVGETELDGPTTPATVNFQEISVYPKGITLNGSVTYDGDTYNFDLYGNMYDSILGYSGDKVGKLIDTTNNFDVINFAIREHNVIGVTPGTTSLGENLSLLLRRRDTNELLVLVTPISGGLQFFTTFFAQTLEENPYYASDYWFTGMFEHSTEHSSVEAFDLAIMKLSRFRNIL